MSAQLMGDVQPFADAMATCASHNMTVMSVTTAQVRLPDAKMMASRPSSFL